SRTASSRGLPVMGAGGSREQRRLPRAHVQLFARGVGLRRNGISQFSPGEAPAPRPVLSPPGHAEAGKAVPSPLVGEGGPSGPDEGSLRGRMKAALRPPRDPSSVSLRLPPSPTRGEGLRPRRV